MGRLVLDIHHVEHGGRKANACRTPRAVEQSLAQLVYINFDLHGETSYRARPLLSSAERIHGSDKSRHLFFVHLSGQAPHGLIVGELNLIDKAIPSTLVDAHGSLAILAELFESIPKRIHMTRGVLVQHTIIAAPVKLPHTRHGVLERLLRDAEPRVGGEPVEQVVLLQTLLAHLQGDGDGVLLDRLVGDLAGMYSRRINIQHRLVYEVFEEERTVRVLRMWTHYE